MSAEVFGEIKIPESLVGESPSDMDISLSILNESLCLFQSEYISHVHHYSHVWVMREYGVAESWTKLFSFDQLGEITNVLGFRNNGDSLHEQSHGYTRELVLHNSESKEIKHLGIQGVLNTFYVDSFMESLVLVNQANDADSGKVVPKKRKIRGMPSQGNTSEVGPSKAPRKGMEIPDLPSQMVMAPEDGGVIRPFSISQPDLGKGYPLPSQIQHICRDTKNEFFEMVEGLKMMLIKAKKQAGNALIQCKSEKDVQAQLEAWIQEMEQRIEQFLTVLPPHDPPSGAETSCHPTPTENHVSSQTRVELLSCGCRALKTSVSSSLSSSSMESDGGFLAQENQIKLYSTEVLRGSKANQAKK